MIRINPKLVSRPAKTEPRFEPGDLVRHKRYHYRGVVVHRDPRCLADDDWYYTNQTQPDREQPWYYVLVHNTAASTYPAEENLELDPDGEPVEHPLVEQFFSDFRGGRYVRNDHPWMV